MTLTELTRHPKLPNLLLNFVYFIKVLQYQQVNFNFIVVLLLCYG